MNGPEYKRGGGRDREEVLAKWSEKKKKELQNAADPPPLAEPHFQKKRPKRKS